MHCKQTSNIAALTISKSCTTNINMTNSNQRIQLYTDEEAMAAGAKMITKYMKAVGILAGSVHLDNPITNSIKTNPTLKRLLGEFNEIEIECLESLLKGTSVNEPYGLESVLNKFTSGKCTKWMPFCLLCLY